MRKHDEEDNIIEEKKRGSSSITKIKPSCTHLYTM